MKPAWASLGLAVVVGSLSACEWIIGIPSGAFTVQDAGADPRLDGGGAVDAAVLVDAAVPTTAPRTAARSNVFH